MRLVAYSLLGSLAVIASAAGAQRLPDTYEPARPDLIVPPSQENLNAKQVREGMIKFARCVARRRPNEARNFVLQVSQATWNALEKKIDDDCALAAVDDPGEEVSVSSNSKDILLALAEVLVQQVLETSGPDQIKAAAPLPLADPLMSVGECAVRSDPIAARALLKTRLNSKEEARALQAMAFVFGGCLPKGTQVRFDATSMRGAVAVNYYRLANAPASQATAGNQRGSEQ